MRPAPLAVATVLSAALLLAGCSSGGSVDPRETQSSQATPSGIGTGAPSPTRAAPTGRPDELPLAFDTASETSFSEVDVRDVSITDDVVVTVTPEALRVRSLPDLDTVASIEAPDARYTDVWVSDDDETAYAVAMGGVVAEGTSLGAETLTVQRIDLASGEVDGEETVDVPQHPGSAGVPSTARVVGQGDGTAVIDVWSSSAFGDPFGEARARHTTVAIPFGSGTGWLADNSRPLAVSDGVVVASQGRAQDPGPVVGLAVDDGAQRWTALPGTKAAALVGVADDLVVVTAASGASRDQVVTLNTASGVVASTERIGTWAWTCRPAQGDVAVCAQSGRAKAMAWNIAGAAYLWRLPTQERFAPTVSAVEGDRVYGVVGGSRGVVLDARSGEDVADQTGAAPAYVSIWGGVSVLGDQAVFQPVDRS